MLNAAIDTDDGNPTLRTLARDALAKWNARISKIVQQGINDGQTNLSADPYGVANLIIAMLEGEIMIVRLEGSRRAPQDVQTLLAMHLATLMAKPTAKIPNS